MFEIKARHCDDGAAVRQQTVHENLHAIDVEERQDRESDIVCAVGQHVLALLDVRREVVVSQDHTLAAPGSTRRVRQHHRHRRRVDWNLFGQWRATKKVENRWNTVDGVDGNNLGYLGAFGSFAGDVEEHADRDENGGM